MSDPVPDGGCGDASVPLCAESVEMRERRIWVEDGPGDRGRERERKLGKV